MTGLFFGNKHPLSKPWYLYTVQTWLALNKQYRFSEFRDKKAVLYDAVTSQFVSMKVLIQLSVELPPHRS